MSLIDAMMVDCVFMDKIHASDGMGGYTTTWTEGAGLKAAIVKDSTMEARVAEKQGVSEIYTITVQKGLVLEYHDVIKRVSDGAIFRITSNIKDSESPDVSTLRIGQVTAEKWELV